MISSLQEAVTVACNLASEWPGEVWWRGHSSEGFALQPGIYRSDRGSRAEQNLTLRFRQRAATRYGSCPEQKDFVSWLFLMQHYGVPTRLLDWSASILVALYFAVSELPDDDARLYALEPRKLNVVTTGDSTLVPPTSNPASELFRGAFDDRLQCEQTIAVLAHEIDNRMLLQQAAFTIHGCADPLDEHAESAQFLRAFDVRAAEKQAIVAQLETVGLRRSTLFPDLESLAADLKRLRFG